MSVSNLRQIYLSLAYPHLLYCSAIWGGAHKTYLNPLVVAQKKLVRIMSQSDYRQHTSPIFRQHHLLKLHDIFSLQTSMFVFKSVNNLHPIETGFQIINHSITTRGVNDLLRIPQCRTSHAQQSVISRGSRSWNSFPSEIRQCATLNSLKRAVKKLFLDQY